MKMIRFLHPCDVPQPAAPTRRYPAKAVEREQNLRQNGFQSAWLDAALKERFVEQIDSEDSPPADPGQPNAPTDPPAEPVPGKKPRK